MHVVFLSSRVPLTKTLVARDGVIKATPYPQVAQVSSHQETVNTIDEFATVLKKHAALGHCLLNGALLRPLANESRAGLTAKTSREWVVFDFDKVPGASAEDIVKTYLPPECQNVSYVAQLSSSMHRPDNTLWSGHIFMLLDAPADEMQLKAWFEFLNFNTPSLTEQLKLSGSQQALHWPLDRTVAYNSKLVYIAPPKIYGFKSALADPIAVVKKKRAKLAIPAFVPIDSYVIRAKINELRRDVGLAEISYETTRWNGEDVLVSTEEVEVSDIKASGNHYIRFNLNSGDSHAYYIDLRNPELIGNFKGEPFLKTVDAAPALHKALRKVAARAVSKPALNETAEVMAFYATNRSAQVMTGLFDPLNNFVRLDDSNARAAQAWLSEYGVVRAGDLPHIDVVFNPSDESPQYFYGATTFNVFTPTTYMTQTKTSDKASTFKDAPPTVSKIIRSVLGSPEDAVITHFMNWLAYIFQFRKKTTTAWIVHGRTGTGKGVLYNLVLKPLFGNDFCQTINYKTIMRDFNGQLERALIVWVDEADAGAVDNDRELMMKIKTWVTEPEFEINRKGVNAYTAANYSNFVLSSNMRTPAVIAKDDRRFNIPPRQELPLHLTPNEILQLQTELETFADVLKRWPVNETAVRQVLESEARDAMHEASTPINQLIAEAIHEGNLQFFVDRTPSDIEAQSDFNNRVNPLPMYKDLLAKFQNDAEAARVTLLNDADLFVLFRTMVPDTRFFQDSRVWRKRHFKSLGLDTDKRVRLPGEWDKRGYGVLAQWKQANIGEIIAAPKPSNVNVTPIKSRKTPK
ncbi:MAG: hypothetical protein DDT39_00016 [Firmicutes bacterium]|nr:hypothetical protein [candidate division NPL-UPA2 bacterium]